MSKDRGFRARKKGDRNGNWLDMAWCAIREARPSVCRLYPVGRVKNDGSAWLVFLRDSVATIETRFHQAVAVLNVGLSR